MGVNLIYPVNLSQISRYSFQIEWSDGVSQEFRLSELQQACPCKVCLEIVKKEVDPLVLADKISTVGKYGIRVQFTSGCLHGIYSFSYLRTLGSSCK